MSDSKRYSDDDVRAIIERALLNAPSEGGLTHDELIAVGEQVGLPSEAMTRAAEEVRANKLEAAARRALTSRRRRWLAGNAGLFALINGLLFLVNYLTTPGEWWALFPIFVWGLALILHGGLSLLMPISPATVARERRRIAGEASAASRLRVAASNPVEPQPHADREADSAQLERRA